ncbi:MAG TPA: MarP family serine protease [Acidimicrobiales bacterium]|nr:MarP family serine protease [Acidimicrobiales bacterium]
MNVFDLVVVVVAVAAAVGGYRLGFVQRATSWVGLAAGVAAGAVLLTWAMPEVHDAREAVQSLVAVGLLVGSALIGQALGLVLGSTLHAELPRGTARRADQAAGAVVGGAGVVVALWLLVPVLAHVPGWTATQARGSAIAREVTERLPRPPDAIEALGRIVGDEPFPQVFEALRPAPDAGTAPTSTGMAPATVERVVRSTVKVTSLACSRIQEGSGFFVDDDLVVTNAHVVAGAAATEVELADGSTVDATAVAFDPGRDVAVLRTEGQAPPLPLADGSVGDAGGVFGHPGGGPLEISPFRVAEQLDATGRDIYDRTSARRDVLVLASHLAPGDSGSALVDPGGAVVGLAFAVAPDEPGVAYALATSEVRHVLGAVGGPTGTGGCLV